MVCAQELNTDAQGVGDLSTQLRGLGWHSAIVPSQPTNDGLRAGVAILALAHISMAMIVRSDQGTMTWDLSPRNSPGRLCVSWVDTTTVGGIILGSAYLWCTEGLTERNRWILASFAAFTVAKDMPWILAGDFNVDPDHLIAEGIDKAMRARIVYDSKVGSCRTSGGNRSRLDYYIVDERLVASGHVVDTLLGIKVAPHSPVLLKIGEQRRNVTVRKLMKPKAWPLEIPKGCQLPPPEWPKPLENVAGNISLEEMDEYWSQLGTKAEEELNTYFNFEGAELKRHKGHAEPHVFKLQPLLPAPTFGRAAKGQLAKAAGWLSRHLEDLVLLSKALRNRGSTSQRMGHFRAYLYTLVSTDALVPLYEVKDTPWRAAIMTIFALQGQLRVTDKYDPLI